MLFSLALTSSSTCLLGQAVYVANAGSRDVSAYTINAGSGALTAVPGSPFPAGLNPEALVVDPSGKFVYVANVSSTNVSAYTVNASNGALTAVPGSPFPGGAISGIAADPTGKFVYVTYGGSSVSAYAIDTTSGALTAIPGSPFPTGNYPWTVAVHPSGKFLYVACSSGGFPSIDNVSVFSIDSGSGALAAIPGSPFKTVQGGPHAVLDPAGRFLYLMGIDDSLQALTFDISAYAINPGSGALSAAAGRPVVPVGSPDGLAIDPTGKFAYVASRFPDVVSVYAINAGSGAWTEVPGSPFAIGVASGLGGSHSGVAVDPTGKFVYVTNDAGASPQINPSNNVSAFAINAGSGALTPVPGSPFSAQFAPAAIAIHNLPAAPLLPAITSLAPSSASSGGAGLTLTITGAGFLSGDAVEWNGAALATTFVSATQLTAAVPASLIATAGSASVTVSNPGGMASKAVNFTINPVSISISANGVLNGASQVGGAVSPGEIVTISGSGFGTGAQALFDGVAAPLLSAQGGQVTTVVPYEVSGNPSTQLQVSYQGQTSSAVTIPVAAAAPGIFTADSSGGGQGLIANEDGTANAPGNAASVGSTVTVYATGEGQTIPAGVDGKPGDSPAPVPILPVTATVGGLDAPVISAGGISGMTAGYLQVSVQIPQGVTTGDAVPIVLNIGGISSQANVTLALQ